MVQVDLENPYRHVVNVLRLACLCDMGSCFNLQCVLSLPAPARGPCPRGIAERPLLNGGCKTKFNSSSGSDKTHKEGTVTDRQFEYMMWLSERILQTAHFFAWRQFWSYRK
jgi:hypothetical protein